MLQNPGSCSPPPVLSYLVSDLFLSPLHPHLLAATWRAWVDLMSARAHARERGARAWRARARARTHTHTQSLGSDGTSLLMETVGSPET